MKSLKKMITLLVAFAMIVSTPLVGLAERGKDDSSEAKKAVRVETENKNKVLKQKELDAEEKTEDELELEEELENTEEEGTETEEPKGKGNNKEWKKLRDKIKEEKKALLAKDKELKAQIKEAMSSGDAELAEQLKAQKDALKEGRKELQYQMVEITRNKYTEEELKELCKKAEELEKEDEEIEVLPVEKIIIDVEGEDVKFNAPPILKDGRALVPVRDLAEGFSATVEWVSEEQKVTISTDDTEIILHIDSNVALINGQEVEIDSASTLYNGSTYVPLRFIAESLGLEVYYDSETGVIEVYDEEENIVESVDEVTGEEETVE